MIQSFPTKMTSHFVPKNIDFFSPPIIFETVILVGALFLPSRQLFWGGIFLWSHSLWVFQCISQQSADHFEAVILLGQRMPFSERSFWSQSF